MTDSLAAYVEAAESYANENNALRAAVGAAPGDALELRPLGEGEHNINFKLTVSSWDAQSKFAHPRSNPHDLRGCANSFAHTVEQAYVLRVNVLPQPFHTCQVRYEWDALKAVVPSGCTPLPVFVDSSAEALAEGVLVETFCPGHQLDFDELRPGDLSRCAAIMANIHSVPVSAACPLHRPADPLRELYQECLERFDLYRASAFEDTRITGWVNRFCALTAKAIEEAGAPDDALHIVNTEPLASHFLLTEGECAGWFVDWERPILGEVAQDLAFFLAPTTTFWDSDYLMPAAEVPAFLDQYWAAVNGRFAPGAFERRFPAWMKVSVLRAVAWCCKALIRYNGSTQHQTTKGGAKLPIYLSNDFLEMLLAECFSS